MAKEKSLEGYITVAERIQRFYEKYPEGRIITTIVEHDREAGFILMKAEGYRRPDDAEPASTGHAYELRGQGFVNQTNYIENCEQSACGRMLALLGFEVKAGIASREEMAKVQRMNTLHSDPVMIDAEQFDMLKTLSLNLVDVGIWKTKDELQRFMKSSCGKDNRRALTHAEAAAIISDLERKLHGGIDAGKG